MGFAPIIFNISQSCICIFLHLQSAKGAKIFSAAVAAATGEGHQTGKEGEEKVKMHTHSYCCLDYAQVVSIIEVLFMIS
jgi:hypothetical protein